MPNPVPLPPAPDRNSPATFAEAMKAFSIALAAQPQFYRELASGRSSPIASSYVQLAQLCGYIIPQMCSADSVSNLEASLGLKTLSCEAGRAWRAGHSLLIYNDDAALLSTLLSYDTATGQATVEVSQVFGAGSYLGWQVAPLPSLQTLTAAGALHTPKTSWNQLTNGQFAIAQGFTSGTPTTSDATYRYVCDMWAIWRPSGATLGSASATWTAASSLTASLLQVERVNASGDQAAIHLSQVVESSQARRFAGRKVRLAFKARKGSGFTAASLSVGLAHGAGTDEGGASLRAGTWANLGQATTSVNLTTSWTEFSVYLDVPSTATELAVVFSYTPIGLSNGSDWYQIADVSLDLDLTGSSATYRRSYTEELAACQRYYAYQVDAYLQSNYSVGGSGFVAQRFIPFPQFMRATPTLTVASTTPTNATVTSRSLVDSRGLILLITQGASAGTFKVAEKYTLDARL